MNNQELGDSIIVKAIQNKISVAELEQYISHESPYVRSSAAAALGKIQGKGRYDIWLKILEDDEELVVGDAITAAPELKDSRCVLKLQELYLNRGFQVRTRVINALAQSQYPEAMQILEGLQEEEKDSNLLKILEETITEMYK